jgi:hypothetical protein
MHAAYSRVVFALCLPFAAACGGSTPTAPSQQGPLTLTITPTPARLGALNTALFFVTLKNTGSETVTLNFPSSCQVMPYVAERSTSKIVHPAGGAWGCATVLTTLTLVPGEARIDPITVSTMSALPEVVKLPAGDYVIYAKMDEAKYHLQSASIPFTLTQ